MGEDILATSLDCGTTLKIEQVQSYYLTLKDFLTSPYKVIIFEGGALEKIELAPLQLLICFIKAAKQQGIQCQWNGVSNTLLEYAHTLGLDALLQIK